MLTATHTRMCNCCYQATVVVCSSSSNTVKCLARVMVGSAAGSLFPKQKLLLFTSSEHTSSLQRQPCHLLQIRRGRAQGNGHRASAHSSSSSTTGVVVDDRMVRWVPYKHANGMAIYYRQTPADEGISQVGSCMVSMVLALVLALVPQLEIAALWGRNSWLAVVKRLLPPLYFCPRFPRYNLYTHTRTLCHPAGVWRVHAEHHCPGQP